MLSELQFLHLVIGLSLNCIQAELNYEYGEVLNILMKMSVWGNLAIVMEMPLCISLQ
jgi:hypothetical protein